MDSAVKGGKSVRRPTRVDQRCPQGPQHIGFALCSAGPAGQTQRTSQLTYAIADITDITQNDPGRLVELPTPHTDWALPAKILRALASASRGRDTASSSSSSRSS